jgi:hypothetical protein
VEPAVANTLTLKGFAVAAMKMAGASPVGYWGSLDYDFAFYSGRNIQFVTKPDPRIDFVVSSEDDYKLMPPAMRANYEIILRSGPTDFNGTGRMMLLKRIGSTRAPEVSSAPPLPSAPSNQAPAFSARAAA